MVDEKKKNIELFHKLIDFEKENGITALSPPMVMHDLKNEINASPDELYVLANKLIDGIFSNDNPFLYGERIAAVQTISDNGLSGIYYLEDMSPDDAYAFLLQCNTDEFISVVDIVAKENQGYYTTSWLPETFATINESIKKFQNKKLTLDDKIQSAASRVDRIPSTDKAPVKDVSAER